MNKRYINIYFNHHKNEAFTCGDFYKKEESAIKVMYGTYKKLKTIEVELTDDQLENAIQTGSAT